MTFGFYGRSGQGVETAVRLFSKACFQSGFYVQSFAFIGRGRRVFPVQGYVKIDKTPILSRQVEDPDYYVILDPTLGIEARPKDAKGAGHISMREKSIVLFNSPEKVVSPVLKKRKVHTYHVDATELALAHLKANIPNTVMLGALAKLFNKVSMKSLKAAMEGMPREDFAAFDEGYKEVK
ncbi:MAG: 2-oxoacid:acceptor oxidoreductase family protein [Candidatus Aenigmarchaeota archaeon]|nr:2-oxoacid:acceptor oxidoreductase family protein [Candidatus Aenigmarchaeota archaeon]